MNETRSSFVALLSVLGVLAAPAAAGAIAPTTTRVVNASGQELNSGSQFTDVSRDGRWVAFASTATNAVAGATAGLRQIYLADRATGELRLVSATAGGTPGNYASSQPAISADGRYVAFQSAATNLTSGATNTSDDIYVYDRSNATVRRLSTSVTGGDANDWARDARISADGSTVVFSSPASNLVAGDAAYIDVFAVATAGGPIERVSARANGTTANGTSVNGSASDGGRFVVFATDATDVVAPDTNGKRDIVVLDRATGARTRASVSATGGEANGDANLPSITADGCLIVFVGNSTNLVASDDRSGVVKAFVRDRCAGNTEIASLRNDSSQGPVASTPAAISDDGCIVAMVTAALLPPAPSGGAVVLRDRCQGATLRADISSAGELGNGAVASWPRLSAGNGRYVSFDSVATNLVPGDANTFSDVFVHDRANAQAPVADLQVRADGLRVAADASASRDPDGRIVTAKIGWGDGSADDTGLKAAHVYRRAGTFSVTLVVTDSDGLVATASKAVTIGDPATTVEAPAVWSVPAYTPLPGEIRTQTPAALALTRVALSRTTFAPVPARGAAAGARGADLTLTASDAATLELRFTRLAPGRTAGGTCKPGARHGRRCTVSRAAGTTAARLLAGRNRVALTGRVGTRALGAGRYRLTLVARATGGRVSAALTRTLTITKEHS